MHWYERARERGFEPEEGDEPLPVCPRCKKRTRPSSLNGQPWCDNCSVYVTYPGEGHLRLPSRRLDPEKQKSP
jgi:hypothetical protein